MAGRDGSSGTRPLCGRVQWKRLSVSAGTIASQPSGQAWPVSCTKGRAQHPLFGLFSRIVVVVVVVERSAAAENGGRRDGGGTLSALLLCRRVDWLRWRRVGKGRRGVRAVDQTSTAHADDPHVVASARRSSVGC